MLYICYVNKTLCTIKTERQMRIILTQILLLISIISFGQQMTTIKISVPNETDEVFIVGNQESLGNWQPNKVKMKKVTDYQREISLNLTFPAEFKFIRGNWESEAIINKIYNQPNIVISIQPNKILQYNIQGWTDQLESYSTYSKFLIKTLHVSFMDNNKFNYISCNIT